MIGLERNGDVVRMSSYAPLLAHVDAWQWTPDLIWFDNLGSYATPNYYVQQMFMCNAGDTLLPLELSGVTEGSVRRFYASATLGGRGRNREIILKVVNATGQPISVNVDAGKSINGFAGRTTLRSDDLEAVNSLEAPERVAPLTDSLEIQGPAITVTFEANSFTVLRIPIRD